MKKADLIDILCEEYSKWEAFLTSIGSERMVQAGVNGVWSMKDIVAHLTGWNRWLVARMQAARLGKPEPYPPWPAKLQKEDEINAWIYETNRSRSLSEVLDESQRVFQDLFTLLDELPEEVQIEKIDPKYYLVWLNDQRFEVSEFFDHYQDDHEPDVHVWLMRSE